MTRQTRDRQLKLRSRKQRSEDLRRPRTGRDHDISARNIGLGARLRVRDTYTRDLVAHIRLYRNRLGWVVQPYASIDAFLKQELRQLQRIPIPHN